MELNRSAKLPGYDIVGHCRRETVGLLPSPAPESNNGRMFAKMFGVEAKATLSHAIRDVEAGNTDLIASIAASPRRGRRRSVSLD